MATKTCASCGGTRFTLTDGFMYCDTCGSMLENFEELVEEDGERRNIGAARIRTKKTTKKNTLINEEEESVRKVRVAFTEAEKIKEKSKFLPKSSNAPTVSLDCSPDYLYRAGIRLSTFSQLLHRCSQILIKDLNMPAEYSNKCLAIFQKYLEHCQIAFCDEELTDKPDEQFVAFIENKNYEVEEAERKRKRMEQRKSKGLKTLEQSTTAWQLLTQGNLDETLAMDDDDNVDESIDDETMEVDDSTMLDDTRNETEYLKKITTHLSKESVKRSSQILLNIEFVATILYSAALSVGCQNICLSDFVRWIREDRFSISIKEIDILKRGGHDPFNRRDDQGEPTSSLDHRGTGLEYPLYEIYRSFVLFQQSLNIGKCLAEPKFEKLAARLIDNLNLPTDLFRRVLILHNLIPCDLSIDSKRQVRLKDDSNLRELVAMKPHTTYQQFMYCFGIRENLRYDPMEEEVILGAEVKILAYILFALKLSIDLDTKHIDDVDHIFNIDTYLHQLEMRVKCWQGHDMSLVLRQSAIIPEMNAKMPFGDNYRIKHQQFQNYGLRLRRQHGFRQCVPQCMSFESTYKLPTVFTTRQNSQHDTFSLPEATLSPLKYQKRVCRREMQEEADKFENCDEQSIETFNINFRDAKIVENSTSDFSSIFPACSKYLKYNRPDRTSRCLTRKTRGNNDTIHRIYLSQQTIQDVFLCAEDSFSERFSFLLKSFALTIGEDFRALYAAFLMIETHFLEPDKIHKLHHDFLNNESVFLQFDKYRSTGEPRTLQVGVTSQHLISKIEDLDLFQFSRPFEYLSGILEDVEMRDDSEEEDEEENQEEEDDDDMEEYASQLKNMRFSYEKTKEQENREFRLYRNGYDFDTIFAILTLKCW